MQSTSLIREWNGKEIRQRADGWLSLTDMASACGKKFADWQKLDGTKSYIAYAEGIMQICIMVSNVGGTPTETGTWGHPKVAIKFACWLSVEFEFQVTAWIEELLEEGRVDIREVPIVDIEAVKAVEVMKPRLITQQHESYSQMLPERTNWIKGMGLERDRIIRTWKSNPIVCAQLLADHDATVSAQFPAIEPVAKPPCYHIYRDRDGTPTEFNLTEINGLLENLTFVTVAYIRTIVDMPPTMKVQTLLRALGWTLASHVHGGTREAFDVPRGEHSEGIPCWVRTADYALISSSKTDVISSAVLKLVPSFVRTLDSGDAVDLKKLTIAFNLSQNVMHVSPLAIQGVLIRRHGYRQVVRYERFSGPVGEPYWVNLPLQRSGWHK